VGERAVSRLLDAIRREPDPAAKLSLLLRGEPDPLRWLTLPYLGAWPPSPESIERAGRWLLATVRRGDAASLTALADSLIAAKRGVCAGALTRWLLTYNLNATLRRQRFTRKGFGDFVRRMDGCSLLPALPENWKTDFYTASRRLGLGGVGKTRKKTVSPTPRARRRSAKMRGDEKTP